MLKGLHLEEFLKVKCHEERYIAATREIIIDIQDTSDVTESAY